MQGQEGSFTSNRANKGGGFQQIKSFKFFTEFGTPEPSRGQDVVAVNPLESCLFFFDTVLVLLNFACHLLPNTGVLGPVLVLSVLCLHDNQAKFADGSKPGRSS